MLARMSTIAVSIDTVDRTLLRRIRRKVDVRQIFWNIQAIRAAAMRIGQPSPDIQFLCGLYDRNSLLVEDLAHAAVALGIRRVSFWNLISHNDIVMNTPPDDRVTPLDGLPEDELRPRLAAIERALDFLTCHKVEAVVVVDFVTALARRMAAYA